MAKNKINDLRDHLFATLESLRDEENPMDIERAKAVASVAQAIINSAMVEVKMVEAIGGSPGSEFFRIEEDSRPLPKLLTAQARTK